MKKSILICAALTMLASVGYAGEDSNDNVTIDGAKHIIILKPSKDNKINGYDNVIGGRDNEVSDEFLDIAIANKNKSEAEIKKEISKELNKKYKKVLDIVKANEEKKYNKNDKKPDGSKPSKDEIKETDAEIFKKIERTLGSNEAAKYDFEIINNIIENVKQGNLKTDEDILYKAFDPIGRYNNEVIQKVIAEKNKDDKELKKYIATLDSYRYSSSNILLGQTNKAKNSEESVVMGHNAEVENSNSEGNVAIGFYARAKGRSATAVGTRAVALNNVAVALGYNARSYGKSSTSIGANAMSYGNLSTAVGSNSKVIAEEGTALGYGAEVSEKYSVALGSSSKAGEASVEAGYRPYSKIDGKYTGITLEEILKMPRGPERIESFNTMLRERVWKANYGVVSIGGPNGTRQITNVAAGYYNTDAVNVAQLKELKTYVDNSTPFEYATKDNKSLYKYGKKYYYKEKGKEKVEYTGEVIIKAKELHKLSNIASSLGDGNTTSTGTTPAPETSENENNVVVIKDLKTIKENKADKAYVDEKVAKLNEKTDLALSGVSSAVAMANLPQVGGDRKFNLAASYGYYGGSHSVAVGLSGTNDKQNFTYKLSGAVNSKGNLAFGIGAGVMLGSVNNKDKVIEQLKDENKEMRKEINELKEVVRKLIHK